MSTPSHSMGAFRVAVSAVVFLLAGMSLPAAEGESAEKAALGEYVVIGWNDLGMHCMNNDFEGIAILPPFNNVWAQVVHRSTPPSLVQTGVSIEYRFPDNTESASKTNFWSYEDKLFGVDLPLNIGLTGNGLTGALSWNGTAFEATGIPIVPYDDATPTVEQPYQLAELTLKTPDTGAVLDTTTIVVPVSTEMNCGLCHNGKAGKQDIVLDETTGFPVGADLTKLPVTARVVWQDILGEHPRVDGQSLLNKTPVLCASCHSSNALGTAGRPGLPSLSEAIHKKHGEDYPNLNCYSCHPGSQTQCLRGAMYLAGNTCQDCHGNLRTVGQSISDGRRPWIDEPRCGTCHADHPENSGKLYRNSTGHGGMYCTACHGSPHAEVASSQPRDNLQAIRLQGRAAPLGDCKVCHETRPTGPGPHGLMAPQDPRAMWVIR